MIVVPALDILRGRVVRLRQGVVEEETLYSGSPVDEARRWEDEGAERLHVVDLEAATGGPSQIETVVSVIAAVRIPVEVGGGIRLLETALRYKDEGADRVIFGTAAVSSRQVVQSALTLWPEAVVVALDARDGRVVVGGWKETTTMTVSDLAAEVKAWGIRRIQYTDVVRDGTLVGPNRVAIAELARSTGLKITAGGGIATLEDLRGLAALEALGVDEAIVGTALYERRFTLGQAQEVVNERCWPSA